MREADVFLTVVHDSVAMRPIKVALIKLTDHQIRGLARLLGFSKDLKQFTKSEMTDAFLAALDAHFDGEVPDYVWKIGRARMVNDSMADLRAHVAVAAEELEGDSAPFSSLKRSPKVAHRQLLWIHRNLLKDC